MLKDYTKCMTAALTPGETSAPPPAKMNGAQAKAIAGLKKVTELKDAMCKCPQTDTDCVLAVMKAQKEWADSATKPTDGTALTADEKAELSKRLDPIAADFKKCMKAALTPTR